MKEILLPALAAISVLTSLTVEGLKKILDEKKIKYSANILAVIVAFAITIIGSVLYIIFYAVPVTPQVIVLIVALSLLSFIIATVGYDKLKQAIKQLGGE